jgi:trehalose/maltose transport system permease protein
MSRRARWRLVQRTLFWALVALILFYLLLPFYWAIVSALKSEAELIRTPATYWPREVTLANFGAVLGNATFMRGVLNSALVATAATALSLLVGAFSGYALGQLRFRGKTPSLYLILAMTMFPQVAVLAGLYAVIRVLGMPSLISVTLSYLLFTLPFTIWVLQSFFRGLPASLLQAAQVDGASMMQSFWLVLLPLTAPALVTTGLLAFVKAWNEYLFALTFTAIDRTSRTVPVAIALFSGESAYQQPFGEIMAAAVLVTVPLVLLVFAFQRRIVEGLTSGAVKE